MTTTRRQWLRWLAAAGTRGAAWALPRGRARAASPSGSDDDPSGKVTKLQGAALAIQDAVPRVLAVGSEVYIGDVISTGKGARVQVDMVDGTRLNLGERTQFVVVDYVFRDKESNAVLRLLEGAFATTSGKIMETADASFTVETNTATIGIRGTTFWGGTLDDEFQVALLAGKGVYVETKAGRVDITTVGEGTIVRGPDQPPTPPNTWAAGKLARARATVAFN